MWNPGERYMTEVVGTTLSVVKLNHVICNNVMGADVTPALWNTIRARCSL